MMGSPLVEQILGLSVGAAGTILGEFFWKRRQRTRRKRAVVEEIDRLVAQFLREAGAAHAQRRECRPTGEFLQALAAAEAQLRALFPPAAWQAYQALRCMIPAPMRGGFVLADFVQARAALLDRLRQET